MVIAYVKFEQNATVAGRKGDFNIAYFTDKTIKPLVLNVTNANMVRKFAQGSPFIEDWVNVPIELYIKNGVRNPSDGHMGGAVRIKPTQPKLTKPQLNEKHPEWQKTLEFFKSGKATEQTIPQMKKRVQISKEVEAQLLNLIPKQDA